jgi:FKBP-type peptidyl-prolyl cis-trans isomerase
MKKYLGLIIIAFSIALSFSSCKDDNNLDELRAEEMRLLEEYINTNHKGLEPKSSGLYYIEVEEGTGDSIKVGDQVKIWYTGTLLSNGYEFDSNEVDGHRYTPLTFTAGSTDVIAGMSEGVTYMKLGGKAKLIIPSNLGYKAVNTGDIPRFSTLIFDVEIYKHTKAEQ